MGKGDKGQKKKAKGPVFPLLPPEEILHPYTDSPQRNGKEKLSLFKTFVRNEPRYMQFDITDNINDIAPDVAMVEDFILTAHEDVYHPDSRPPPPGLEWETKGKGKITDAVRLNTLPLAELQKIAIRLNKHKQKVMVGAGMAAQEKLFLRDQLNIVQAKAKKVQQQYDAVVRETDELKAKIRHTTMVYKQKSKHTGSEFHSKAFQSRTDHLMRYIVNQETFYDQEKRHAEVLSREEETSQYIVHLLQRLGKDIELENAQDIQAKKEDFLITLQAQIDSFENFFNDTQTETENSIKKYYQNSDRIRNSTFDNMLQSQERAISELRKYFQGVNLANSSVINQLKNTLNSRRAKLDQVEKDVFKTLEAYAKFVAPIQTNDAEIRKCEVELKETEAVQVEHTKTREYSKALEEAVRRLQWRKEVEIVRLQKATTQYDEIQKAYNMTLLETSRKASVAYLIHDRTRKLLDEERTKYEMAQLTMEALSPVNSEAIRQRDKRIRGIFQEQTEKIEQLKTAGNIIRQKYEHNRAVLEYLFQEKYRKPLSSTGFRFPAMETHLSKNSLKNFGELTLSALDICASAKPCRTSTASVLRVQEKSSILKAPAPFENFAFRLRKECKP